MGQGCLSSPVGGCGGSKRVKDRTGMMKKGFSYQDDEGMRQRRERASAVLFWAIHIRRRAGRSTTYCTF